MCLVLLLPHKYQRSTLNEPAKTPVCLQDTCVSVNRPGPPISSYSKSHSKLSYATVSTHHVSFHLNSFKRTFSGSTYVLAPTAFFHFSTFSPVRRSFLVTAKVKEAIATRDRLGGLITDKGDDHAVEVEEEHDEMETELEE